MKFLSTRYDHAAVVALRLLIKETSSVAEHQCKQKCNRQPGAELSSTSKNVFTKGHRETGITLRLHSSCEQERQPVRSMRTDINPASLQLRQQNCIDFRGPRPRDS